MSGFSRITIGVVSWALVWTSCAFAADPADGMAFFLFRPNFKIGTPQRVHTKSGSDAKAGPVQISMNGVTEKSDMRNVRFAGDSIYFGYLAQEVTVDKLEVKTPRIVFDVPEFNFHTLKFGKKRVDGSIELKEYHNVGVGIVSRAPILLTMPQRIGLHLDLEGTRRTFRFTNRAEIENALCSEIARVMSPAGFDQAFGTRFTNLGIPKEVMDTFLAKKRPEVLSSLSNKLQGDVRKTEFLDRLLTDLDRAMPRWAVRGEKSVDLTMERLWIPLRLGNDEDADIARVSAWRVAGEKGNVAFSEGVMQDLIPQIAIENNNAVSAVFTVETLNRMFGEYTGRLGRGADTDDPALKLPPGFIRKSLVQSPEGGLIYKGSFAERFEMASFFRAFGQSVPVAGTSIWIHTGGDKTPTLRPWSLPASNPGQPWRDFIDLSITFQAIDAATETPAADPLPIVFRFEMNRKGLLKLTDLFSASGGSASVQGNALAKTITGNLKWLVLQGVINTKLDQAMGATHNLEPELAYESIRFLGYKKRSDAVESYDAEAVAVDSVIR